MNTRKRDDDSKIAERSGTIVPQPVDSNKQRIVEALNGLTVGFDSSFSIFKNAFRTIERPLKLYGVEGFQQLYSTSSTATAKTNAEKAITDFFTIFSKINNISVLSAVYAFNASTSIRSSGNTTYAKAIDPLAYISPANIRYSLGNYIQATDKYARWLLASSPSPVPISSVPVNSGYTFYFKCVNSSTTTAIPVSISITNVNGTALTSPIPASFSIPKSTTVATWIACTMPTTSLPSALQSQPIYYLTFSTNTSTSNVQQITVAGATSTAGTASGADNSLFQTITLPMTYYFISLEFLEKLFNKYLVAARIEEIIYYNILFSYSAVVPLQGVFINSDGTSTTVGAFGVSDRTTCLAADIFTTAGNTTINDYATRATTVVSNLKLSIVASITTTIRYCIGIGKYPTTPTAVTAAVAEADLKLVDTTLSFSDLNTYYTKYITNIPSTLLNDYMNRVLVPLIKEYLIDTYEASRKYITKTVLDIVTDSSITGERNTLYSYITYNATTKQFVATSTLNTQTLIICVWNIDKIERMCIKGLRDIVDKIVSNYSTLTGETKPTITAATTLDQLRTIRTDYFAKWQDYMTSRKDILTTYTTTTNYYTNNNLRYPANVSVIQPATITADTFYLNNILLANYAYNINLLNKLAYAYDFIQDPASTYINLGSRTGSNSPQYLVSPSNVYSIYTGIRITTSSSGATIPAVNLQINVSFDGINFTEIYRGGGNPSSSTPFNASFLNTVYYPIYRISFTSTGSLSYTFSLLRTSAYQQSSSTTSELAIVDGKTTTYFSNLRSILLPYRNAASAAITAFTDSYTANYVPYASFLADMVDYASTRTVFAASTADSAALAPTLKIEEIQAFKAKYDSALLDLTLAAKRVELRQAIGDYNKIKKDATTAITVSETDSAVSQANITNLLNADGTWTATVTELKTENAYTPYISTFYTGIKAVVSQILTQFNTYYTDNIITPAAKLEITDATTDITTLNRLTATIDDLEKIQEIGYNYLNVRWPAVISKADAIKYDIKSNLVYAAGIYKITKAEAGKYMTVDSSKTPISAADTNLANVVVSAADGNITLSAAAIASSAKVVLNYIPVFEAGTKQIAADLLTAYDTFRNTTFPTSNPKNADLLLSVIDATTINSDKAYMTDAGKVEEILDNYIGITNIANNSNAYWPTIKRLGTKLSSRVAALQAFITFIEYYNEFQPLYDDIQPDYYNSAFEIIAGYLNADYSPSNAFLSMEPVRIDEITADFTMITNPSAQIPTTNKFNPMVEDVRGFLKTRVEQFNTRYASMSNTIAKSGVPIPADLKGISTDSAQFLNGETGIGLITQKRLYYGTPTVDGYIPLLETLISDAILENKRKDVIAAIEICATTYNSAAPYIDREDTLSSAVNTFSAGSGTGYFYDVVAKVRTRQFLALPIGGETDGETLAATTAAVGSLVQLKAIYDDCTRKITAAIITGFRAFYDQKAGLTRRWEPGAAAPLKSETATTADASTVSNANTGIPAVVGIRDEYISLWSTVVDAAKGQISAQIAAFGALKTVANTKTVPIESLQIPTRGAPTTTTPAYDFQAIYDEYEAAGQSLIVIMRNWLKPRIGEYDSLFTKYDAFQKDPEVRMVRIVGTLDSAVLSNTSGTDQAALDLYEFYTQDIASILSALIDKYVRDANRGIPKLQTTVRENLQEFIPVFNAKWTASRSETREDYKTYGADLATAQNAAATSAQLENVLANYTTYTDDLREADLQQNVLNIMVAFNNTLYMANEAILNVDATSERGTTIKLARDNMLSGPAYVSGIAGDKITSITELQNIRDEYFTAITAIAEQIEEDLRIKLDEFAALYGVYKIFSETDMRDADNLQAPTAIPGTLTVAGIATQKSNLAAAIQQIKDSASATDAESIDVSIGTEAINGIRNNVLADILTLRKHIAGAMKTFIPIFKAKYEAISRKEIKDPYTTYADDAGLVASIDPPASSADLTALIASYTEYVSDLITSNYKLRALIAINNFYSRLYVANAANVLPVLTDLAATAGVEPTVIKAINSAMDDAKTVETVEDDAGNLSEIRSTYQTAANDFVPYIVGRVRTLLSEFDNLYKAYGRFYETNRILRDGAPFIVGLESYDASNTAPSLSAILAAYGDSPAFSDAIVESVDTARVWVVQMSAELRSFIERQMQKYVRVLGESAATSATDAAMQTNTVAALAVIIEEKQAILTASINRFADDLYEPNRDFIAPPAAASPLAKRIAEIAADRQTVERGAPSTMLEMQEYVATLNSLQSAYDVGITDLLTAIRSSLSALIERFNTAYQPNKTVLALPGSPAVSQIITAASENVEADGAKVPTVRARADIAALRERYETAGSQIFDALKTAFSAQLTGFSELITKYEGFRAANESFKALTGVAQSGIENTADTDNGILEGATGLTESVIVFLADQRTRVIFGSYPRLRNLIRDQLRTYIDYFNVQYSQVSTSESKEPYTTYMADIAIVADTANPSAADLEQLMLNYNIYTAQLTTANLQGRVIGVIRDFNSLLLDNYDLVQASLSDKVLGGATDVIGILGRIRNNIDNEIDDTRELLEIEGRYRILTADLVSIVKTALVEQIDNYTTLRGRYVMFIQENRDRFMAALGNLFGSEYTAAGSDKQTIIGHVAYSSQFVADAARIRDMVVPNLAQLRTEVGQQLTAYIGFFAAKVGERSLQKLGQYITYSDATKTADLAKTEYVQLMDTYTTYTSLLLLAAKQEDVAIAVRMYKNDLYDQFTGLLGSRQTAEMRRLADTATTELTAALENKKADGEQGVSETAAALATLNGTETSYRDAIVAFMREAKSVMGTDIGAYRELYRNYVAFDSSFSTFYDLEAIPTQLVGIEAVGNDLIALNSAEPNAAGIAQLAALRIRYYGDGSTTQFAMFGTLVRHVMAQLKLYIERYSTAYRDLADNLKPQGISSDMTATHLARVSGGSYVGVADMPALLTIVSTYIDNTPAIQGAVRVSMEKSETRSMINRFLDAKKYLNDTLGAAVVRKYLSPTLDTVGDLSQLEAATTQTAVSAINMNYVMHTRNLAADSMLTFNTVYGDNLFMRAYFVQSAIDVFNTFNVFFQEDVEKVGTTNTVDQNIALMRIYTDRTKIILDARGSAAELKESADSYKTTTINLIRTVRDERDASVDLQLSSGLRAADPESAEQLIRNATFIADMEPTRNMYDRYLKEIRIASYTLSISKIDAFLEEYNKLGTLVKFLSDDIKAAVAEIQIKRKELAGLLATLRATGPVEGFATIDLTAIQIQELIAKIEVYMDKLQIEANPQTGSLYTNATSNIEQIINEYLQDLAATRKLVGIDTLQIESNTVAATNAARDRKLIADSASFSLIEAKLTEYQDKREELTKLLRKFALDMLENGFNIFYKQLKDEGLLELNETTLGLDLASIIPSPSPAPAPAPAPAPSFANQELRTRLKVWVEYMKSIQTAATDATTATKNLKDGNTSFIETKRIVDTYMGLIDNIKLELARAQTLAILAKVKALLKEAMTLYPDMKFNVSIPSTSTLDTTIANVLSTKVAGFMPTVRNQYVAISSAIIVQFAGAVADAIRAYKSAIGEAKAKYALPYLTEKAKAYVSKADEDLVGLSGNDVSKKTLADLNSMRLKYVEATEFVKSDTAAKSEVALFNTLKNTVSGLITEYETIVGVAQTIPALKLAAESATADKATLAETSLSKATLESLQKKYTDLVASARTYMQKMALQYIENFNQSLIANKSRSDSFTTEIKDAIPKISADILKVGTATTTYTEHRDLIRKYADLSSQLVGSLPVSTNIEANRKDTLALITNYENALESAKVYPQMTLPKGVATATDRAAVAAATTFEALAVIRTRYLQLNYDIGRRLEEAKANSDALMQTRRSEAKKAIADFSGAFSKAAINLTEYPNLADASNNLASYSSQAGAAETTLETLTTIVGIYRKALDVVLYRDAADSVSERESVKQAAILAMDAFTRLYQANEQSAARLSEVLRKGVYNIPGDLVKAQNPATSLAEIKAIGERYDGLTKQLATEIGLLQREGAQELIYSISRLRGQYQQLTPAQVEALPTYIRLDVRILDSDMNTLGLAEVDANTIAAMRTKYGPIIAEFAKYAPRSVGVSANRKTAVVAVIRDMNALFSNNLTLFPTFPTKVQTRIRMIPADIKYVMSDDITATEVDQIEAEYRAATQDIKAAIQEAIKTGVKTATTSLQMVIDGFVLKYRSVDISKLSGSDYNFVQLLMQNRQNAMVIRDVAKATATYTRGIEVLSKIPETADVVEDNQEYVRLKMIINYFLSEFQIRNMARAISNDRLYISNLKANAPSYLKTYKTPAPNMRNYSILVDQLVEQYRDGLKLLRTYPLKA